MRYINKQTIIGIVLITLVAISLIVINVFLKKPFDIRNRAQQIACSAPIGKCIVDVDPNRFTPFRIEIVSSGAVIPGGTTVTDPNAGTVEVAFVAQSGVYTCSVLPLNQDSTCITTSTNGNPPLCLGLTPIPTETPIPTLPLTPVFIIDTPPVTQIPTITLPQIPTPTLIRFPSSTPTPTGTVTTTVTVTPKITISPTPTKIIVTPTVYSATPTPSGVPLRSCPVELKNIEPIICLDNGFGQCLN